ncbi:hypothetical protein SCARR_03186 [Pontiella sulfatireligans]|uniref:Uncharacterized protein n=1 Tax=Pontiella sulfatireligans TaxID=2750658 RepID=A0A6C2UQ31_9BACT|nr:hypothetical protein SCARR_03186 [Pontiella sulfatireligans]
MFAKREERTTTKFAGLTDHPRKAKAEHGNPPDWQIKKEFRTQIQARIWLQEMSEAGCQVKKHGPGWGWGFTYTIARSTK